MANKKKGAAKLGIRILCIILAISMVITLIYSLWYYLAAAIG